MAKCPFCGLETETSHDTQERCIAALHAEIARIRALLSRARSVAVPGPAEREEEARADKSDDALDFAGV